MSDFALVLAMKEYLHAVERQRVAELREETAFLRSLEWTDDQMTKFDTRVSGVASRLERVLAERAQ